MIVGFSQIAPQNTFQKTKSNKSNFDCSFLLEK